MKNLNEDMIRIHQLMGYKTGFNTILESNEILEEGRKKQYKLLIMNGDELYNNGDYEGALSNYKQANSLYSHKPQHKFFIESQNKINKTKKIIEQKKLKEAQDKRDKFNKKLNSLLLSLLKDSLSTIVSGLKVKFTFVDNTFYMLDPNTNEKMVKFVGGYWGGKTNNISPNGVWAVASVNSKDYKSKVLEKLTDEEKVDFEKVGYLPSYPNESISSKFDNGVIGVYIKGLGENGIYLLGYSRIHTGTYSPTMEETACKNVKKENRYNEIDTAIPYEKILYLEGEGLMDEKEICYGGAVIGNTNVGLGFVSPINDILNS